MSEVVKTPEVRFSRDRAQISKSLQLLRISEIMLLILSSRTLKNIIISNNISTDNLSNMCRYSGWLESDLVEIPKPGFLETSLIQAAHCTLVQYTPNKISNWSLFKLIFSDQALIKLKRFFAYICVFKSANV